MTTATASQTLQKGAGNCLSLASVLIGLARRLGLRAFYVDLSHRFEEAMQDRGRLEVRTGHVSAIIQTEQGYVGLDMEDLAIKYHNWRMMDDLEAMGHFLNNRGYELIHDALSQNKPVPWQEAKNYFILATRVAPTLARAWNNLGVAHARLQQDEIAAVNYRQAIALCPSMISPHRNLGTLHMRHNRLKNAAKELDVAAQLAPRNEEIQYQRALIYYHLGRKQEAQRVLERVIDRGARYGPAKALLQKIKTHVDIKVKQW